jgi:hypothetical protein
MVGSIYVQRIPRIKRNSAQCRLTGVRPLGGRYTPFSTLLVVLPRRIKVGRLGATSSRGYSRVLRSLFTAAFIPFLMEGTRFTTDSRVNPCHRRTLEKNFKLVRGSVQTNCPQEARRHPHVHTHTVWNLPA